MTARKIDALPLNECDQSMYHTNSDRSVFLLLSGYFMIKYRDNNIILFEGAVTLSQVSKLMPTGPPSSFLPVITSTDIGTRRVSTSRRRRATAITATVRRSISSWLM
mmetsp:Transcript_9625/g.20770  ORF Transcript_9625/g.20770 Transcript_9625/m.20770 type:complete len:107 (-) Transcript_9625:4034-4354(-)